MFFTTQRVKLVRFLIEINESIFFYKRLKKVFKEIFKNSPLRKVIDVGVNRGQTIKFLHQFSEEIEIIGFEPSTKCINILKNDAEQTYNNYEVMLNENSDGETLDESSMGIARELARMNLTLNTYTQWYWKIDLNNLLHFLALRADAHAQYEIRVYADIILDIVKKWVPITYEAFEDYRVGGTQLSAKEILILKKIIKGETVDPDAEGISKREWGELQKKFDL